MSPDRPAGRSGQRRRAHRPARTRARPRARTTLTAVLAIGLLAACTDDGGDDTSAPTTAAETTGELAVHALSTRPEYVTGGDVLVGISGVADTDGLTVEVDGLDVTDAFAADTSPWRDAGATPQVVGLVTGLADGPHTVTATVDDRDATLDVVNHPISGPLFSGAHQSPFVCTTDAFGLGPPGDDCGARPIVQWQYVATSGQVRDLADPSALPADVRTIDRDGRQVPFLVRVETGVLNRAVTRFAVLDPQPGAPDPDRDTARPWDPSAWNGRLVYRFGGGCGATRSQGDDIARVVEPDLLADGYAVAAATLTTFGTACNDVLAAETVMVAKEQFSESYGVPLLTIGDGGSGGAIQQLLTAQNYPGLLDGIAPAIPFPDAVSIGGGVADCGLLGRFHGEPATRSAIVSSLIGSFLGAGPAVADPSAPGVAWTAEQRQAVSGFASPTTCAIWKATYFENLDPSAGCADALVEAGQVYGPANPRGARCTYQDSNIDQLGRDPETGFALRPLDNVGVQYGLDALREGAIDAEQFVALNEQIGGYDIDGRWQPERMRAPDAVLEAAYAKGRVTAGAATDAAGGGTEAIAGGLVDVPVVLISIDNDSVGDIHDRQRVLTIRERLALPDGSPNPNVATWTFAGATNLQDLLGSAAGSTDQGLDAVRVLDRWLTAAIADDPTVPGTPRTGDAWRARLADTRPADADDRCAVGDDASTATVTGDAAVAEGGPCDVAHPSSSDPRRRAGAPVVNDVLACALTPVDPASTTYGVTFSAQQADRMRLTFPDGVCDWSRPGRGQGPIDGTWLTYR
jgi:hypothetical protein